MKLINNPACNASLVLALLTISNAEVIHRQSAGRAAANRRGHLSLVKSTSPAPATQESALVGDNAARGGEMTSAMRGGISILGVIVPFHLFSSRQSDSLCSGGIVAHLALGTLYSWSVLLPFGHDTTHACKTSD